MNEFHPNHEHYNLAKFVSVFGQFHSFNILGFNNLNINVFGEQVFFGAFLSN